MSFANVLSFEEDDYPIGDYMRILWNKREDKYPYPKNYYLTSQTPIIKKFSQLVHPNNWKPRTYLGRLVKRGLITDLEGLFASGLALQESEIFDEIILHELKVELLKLIPVKVSSKNIQYKAIVVIGCDGYLGLAESYHKSSGKAIERATVKAKLNISKVEVKFAKTVTYGSTKIEVQPKKACHNSLVPPPMIRLMLDLCGLKNVDVSCNNFRKNLGNQAHALYRALKKDF